MFKFGIMGAGSIAQRFCDAIKNLDCAEVGAIASKSEKRAQEFAEKNNIKEYYNSYETMLNESDIDAVYVATTNNFHYENVLLCLKYNIPVVCEKPLAMTAIEAKEIFDISRNKNIFVMEAMWSHFLPSNIKVRELISEGVIGDVISADFNFGFNAYSGHRVFDPQTGGGALYDVGVYGIEGLMYLIDKPVDEIMPCIAYNDDGIDTTDHVILRMGNCLAHVQSSITTNLKNDAWIYGTKGMIHMETAHACRKFILTMNDGTQTSYTFEFNDGFEFEIEEAVRCINNKQIESSYITHQETIRCAEIFDVCLSKSSK